MKKAYTDLEQSKKLAEILPIESADMCYRSVVSNLKGTYTYQPYCFVSTLESDIPCWSLAALFNILPHCIDDRYNLVLGKLSDDKGWYVMYDDVDHFVNIYIAKSDLIEACVEMILKLHEQKLL